jgi:hypothetical protein
MGVTRRSGEYDLIRLERRQRCQNYVERHRRQKQVAHHSNNCISALRCSLRSFQQAQQVGDFPRADPTGRSVAAWTEQAVEPFDGIAASNI